MGKGGRPRLSPENYAARYNISIPPNIAEELRKRPDLKGRISAICTAAINKEMADKVYIETAREVVCKAVSGMEDRLEKHGVLSPDDHLAFAKIRGIIFAIEGDAWIRREKVEEIRRIGGPNNGSDVENQPAQAAQKTEEART